MPVFKIALVNHADHSDASHWDSKVSIRKSRAIKKARKYRAEGNRFVILFEFVNGNWIPISLKSLGDTSKHISNGKPPRVKEKRAKHGVRDTLSSSNDGLVSDKVIGFYRALLAMKEV